MEQSATRILFQKALGTSSPQLYIKLARQHIYKDGSR